MNLLEVKNVSFSYNKAANKKERKTKNKTDNNKYITKAAINNISFSVKNNEVIGVIGHTGSGKSTLMQTLNGLIKPDSGTVYFKGNNIFLNKKELYKFRFKIGLVFQYPEYQLFEETVFKDVSFGPKNMGLDEENINKRVTEALNIVGIKKDLFSKSPFDLSGGQKRRVALAGILAMKPEVLVLDEPTAGLDPVGRKMLLNSIINYKNQNDAAVIIVSHSMEDLAKISDKLLVLNEGNQVAFDTLNNVFKNRERLQSIGLDVPEVTKIMIALKEKGLINNDEVYTVKEAADIITNTFRGCCND